MPSFAGKRSIKKEVLRFIVLTSCLFSLLSACSTLQKHIIVD